jgi:hypothetical protein
LFFSITSLVPTASAASESISNIRLSKADARPGDTLVVTADITSPSGINWVNMILYPPGGGTKGFDTYFNLIAGSEQNGTWSMNFAIPQTAENGVWNLVVGMQTKENLVKTAYGPSINVSGSTTLETKIVKINLSKVKSRPGETLIVTADITSPSGINWVNLILYPPSGGTRSFTTYFNLVSGSEQNGTWSMSFVMSPTAESGVWKLVVGMESKDKLVKVAYGPNIIVSTEADELAAQAAADKAAADKAAADKAAADKAAADKAAADKAAADKAAADKAAQRLLQDDFDLVMQDYQKLLLRIDSLKVKYPRVSLLSGIEKKIRSLPIILGNDLSTAKSNIRSANASLDLSEKVWKKTQNVTITCVKGKLVKKVTAINPVCPSGYKKK